MTVTGGAGFVGRSVVAALTSAGAEVRVIRSREHDLREAGAARQALQGADVVIHLAARVGGIGFNSRNPGLIAHANLAIATNVFEEGRLAGVRRLVAAGSVCAYPERPPVPFSEADLWSGYPEESNAPYGLAKRMLLVLSDAYRRQYGFDSCVPVMANLYGPGDNYDLEDSHVIPAIVRKCVEAADRGDDHITLWGTGAPTREFLYVKDAARAILLAAERLNTSEPVNIGTGRETSIRDVAELIRRLTGFEREIRWDPSRPDGQPSRVLDVSRARALMGFEARVGLEAGLGETIDDFRTASGHRAVAGAQR